MKILLRRNFLFALVWFCWFSVVGLAQVVENAEVDRTVDSGPEEAARTTTAEVGIVPEVDDEAITDRLRRILDATGWFENPQVRVEEGVVFLNGTTTSETNKEWASNLARNTQAVVAVANRMQVIEPTVWDFTPAWTEFRQLRTSLIRGIPLALIALGIFAITWIVAKFVATVVRRISHRRTESPLLREMFVKLISIPILLLGFYLALRLVGLTHLATTVLGGTGLLGLVLGIAFRDIAENFLASILLSVKRPFRAGDLILVENCEGFVQSVTTRGTTLMTLQGNHIHIPNSTIYKSIIHNYTANPNIRIDFVVGIDYASSIAHAQRTILAALHQHPSVLADPEPLILLEELAAATVNLRVLFWINGNKYSMLKVRSAIIRLVKRSIEEAGILMPDESREIIFPKGVPVNMLERPVPKEDQEETGIAQAEDTQASTAGEGELNTEAKDIQNQAATSRRPEEGQELLR